MQPLGMVEVFHIHQIAIAGRVSHFDWSEVEKLTVSWSVLACGNYTLQNADTVPYQTTPPNKAVDVYINE